MILITGALAIDEVPQGAAPSAEGSSAGIFASIFGRTKEVFL